VPTWEEVQVSPTLLKIEREREKPMSATQQQLIFQPHGTNILCSPWWKQQPRSGKAAPASTDCRQQGADVGAANCRLNSPSRSSQTLPGTGCAADVIWICPEVWKIRGKIRCCCYTTTTSPTSVNKVGTLVPTLMICK
jgi:hypothetical protein